MGYHITNNFKTPYLAKNITEFWHRWHISLSTWFRDYVYFPLGGSRVKTPRWIFNIAFVFMLSGFWHGANWTFIFWGGAYALFYIIEHFIKKNFNFDYSKNKLVDAIYNGARILKNFVFVTLIWVFFRSVDVKHIKLMYSSIYHNFNCLF
jgi:D-alanyl-lipoteichoic acid acyltransferase DltB (MBOAT superfamily)